MMHQATPLRRFNAPSILKCCPVCHMGHRTGGSPKWGKAHVKASTDLVLNRSLSLIHCMLLVQLFTNLRLSSLIYTMGKTSYLERLLKTLSEFPFVKHLTLVILKSISFPPKSSLQINSSWQCPFLLMPLRSYSSGRKPWSQLWPLPSPLSIKSAAKSFLLFLSSIFHYHCSKHSYQLQGPTYHCWIHLKT